MALHSQLGHALTETLCGAESRLRGKKVFIGFDAFIDIIAKPIREGNALRIGAHFAAISEMGAYLQRRSGRSASIELDERDCKVGGNAPNVASALGALGAFTECVIPSGSTDPAFAPLLENGRIHSTGEPGLCVALEFGDGKLMLALNRDVNRLGWADIRDRLGLDRLRMLAEYCDALCFLNWSELPGATGIFRGMQRDVLPFLQGKRPLLIDLCDCARRSAGDVEELLETLRAFPPTIRPVLSLNQNEASAILAALGIDPSKGQAYAGRCIIDHLGIDTVVFHRRERSVFVDTKGATQLETPRITQTPMLTTGAGDNFNAGLCAGLLLDFDPMFCLALGSAVAGHYVEHGKSPQFAELLDYINHAYGGGCE